MQCDPLLKMLGTSVPELVLSCCENFPNQDTIEKIIELDDTGDRKQLVESIFNPEEKERKDCLRAAFTMMERYYEETGQFPNSTIELYNEFESLFVYLLGLAEQNNVDTKQAINVADKTGISLFHLATLYSELVSNELISREVQVNRIDNQLITPVFKVRYLYTFHV